MSSNCSQPINKLHLSLSFSLFLSHSPLRSTSPVLLERNYSNRNMKYYLYLFSLLLSEWHAYVSSKCYLHLASILRYIFRKRTHLLSPFLCTRISLSLSDAFSPTGTSSATIKKLLFPSRSPARPSPSLSPRTMRCDELRLLLRIHGPACRATMERRRLASTNI